MPTCIKTIFFPQECVKKLIQREKLVQTRANSCKIRQVSSANESLLNEVEKEQEQEFDFYSNNGFNHALGSIGNKIIELFLGEIEEVDIPESAKIALKTRSTLVYVLTNKKF